MMLHCFVITVNMASMCFIVFFIFFLIFNTVSNKLHAKYPVTISCDGNLAVLIGRHISVARDDPRYNN